MSIRYLSGINVDGGTLVVDDANNRVGIGTASPTSQLHVQSASPALLLYNTTTAGGTLNFVDQAWQSQIVGIQGNLLFKTGGTTERMKIDSSGYVYLNTYLFAYEDISYTRLYRPNGTAGLYLGGAGDTSNYYDNDYHYFRSSAGTTTRGVWNATGLGIGTTSPGTKLVVVGGDDAAGVGVLEIQTAGGTNLKIGGNSTYSWIQSHSSNPLYINQLGNNVILNSGGGNVGIGTTSPVYKLDVSGTARVTSTLIGGGRISAATEYRLNDNSYSRVAILDGGGSFAGGYNFNINGGTPQHDSTGAVAAYYYNSAGYISLYTNSSQAAGTAASERLRITSAGNVGIGTTSPANKLYIVSSAQNSGLSVMDFNGAGGWGGGINLGVSGLSFESLGKVYTYLTNGGPGTVAGDMRFQTASGSALSDRMVITSAGNVGIGTTSPGYKLDVNGVGSFSNGFSGPSSETGYRLKFYDNGGIHNDVGIGLDGTAGGGEQMWFNALGGFYWGLGTGGTKMRLDSNGNVGIGTTAPASILHVSTTGANTYSSTITKGSNMKGIVNTLSNNGDDMVGIYFATGTNAEGTHWSGITGSRSQSATDWSTQLNFYTHDETVSNITDATQKMVIKGSGNVGIGTTSPTEKLHVAGNGLFTGGVYVNNTSAYLWNTTNGVIRFGTNNTERARLDAAGNFGIGTTSPAGHMLDIASTAGSANNSAIRALYPAGGGLLNTEFGALAYRGGAWTAVYGKQGAASSAAYFDGNVGIGTASPIAKLHINSATNPLSSAIQGDSKLVISGVDGNMDLLSQDDNTTVANSIGLGRYNQSTGALIHKFGIVGWANTGSAGSNTGNRIAFHYGTSANAWDNSELMSITSSGNVLIGTTTDAGYKLDTNGVIRATQFITVRGASNSDITAYNNPSATSVNLGTLLNEFAFIDLSSSNAGGSWIDFSKADGGDYSGRIRYKNSTDEFQFFTAGNQRAVITSTGNVGIGTTNPGTYKLNVNGTASFASNVTFGGYIDLTSTLYLRGNVNYLNAAGTGWNTFLARNGERFDAYLQNAYANGVLTVGSTATFSNKVTLDADYDLIFQQPNSYSHGIVWKNTAYTKDSASIRPTGQGAWAVQGLGFYTGNAADSTTAPSLRFNIQAGGDSIFYNNVGIGTTGPAYRLDVSGTTRIQGDLITTGRQYVQSTPVNIKLPWTSLSINGSAVGDAQASDGTAVVRYSASGNDTFFYGPYQAIDAGSYVARFRIKVASNASASYIGYIDVVGTNISGESVSLRPNMFPTGGDYYYIDVPFNCNNDSSVFETRWIGWVTGITDTYIDHVLIVPQSRTNNVYVTDGDSYTIYEAQLPRLFIANGSGNVGIGTTSPAAKLQVIGTGRTFNAVSTNDQAAASFGSSGYAVSTIGFYGVGSANDYNVRIGANVDAFVAYTNDTERLRITSSGNVGIGTTAPGGRLHIATPDPATNFVAIDFRNPTYGIYGKSNSISGRGNTLEFTATDYNTNGSVVTRDVLTLRPEGNVGIGTTSPAVKLHVAGTNETSVRVSDSGGSYMELYQQATDSYILSSNALRFYNGGSERMRITSAGNVGIGTTSPSVKLQVVGSEYIQGGFLYMDNAMPIVWGSSVSIEGDSTGNTLSLKTSSSTRIQITSAGNVGIGTTSPQQLLHVLGATNGYMMVQGANDAGQAGIYFKKEDTTGTMDRTKGLIVFHTNVGSGWGRGHLGFCLNSSDSNTVVSVTDEKFRMVDNGDFLADGDVVAYSTTISDERYKTNITPIESALDKVNQMRGVSFDWTAVRSGREFGVIAQEIEKIAPEVVSEKELLNGETMKTVSYTSLVPFLIESIKELTARVEELEQKLKQ